MNLYLLTRTGGQTWWKVGDSAPDFTLVDQNRNEVTLSQFQGEKSVVLSWHIHSFTGG